MEVMSVFLGICLILFFGYFAEYLFKKFFLPDVLFLILLGVALGHHGFNLVPMDNIIAFAPYFTTFTLLFLVFDGAFNIDLKSFAKGIPFALSNTLVNFIISTALASAIFSYFFGILPGLLAGVAVGGISSAYVMPVLQRVALSKKAYSILAMESALTDVLCIGIAVTLMEIIGISQISQVIVTKLASIFSVAIIIGMIGGYMWIVTMLHIFKEEKSYILTIAFLILLGVISEALGGNAAITALVFGLVLKNSKILTELMRGITGRKKRKDEYQFLSVISKEEQFFYDQISFFLKTFFFVYIGLLLDLSDPLALLVGVLIAVIFYMTRRFSSVILYKLPKQDKQIISSVFARGIAAAAIMQLAVERGVLYGPIITKIVYIIITISIIISSIHLFLMRDKTFKNTASPP